MNLSDFNAKLHTRSAKLLAVEHEIVRLQPEFLEAYDMLDAIWKALETRYDDQDITDILHELQQLKEALEEADRTQVREPDEMNLSKWIEIREAEEDREVEERLLRSEDERTG